jgi:hypothetical protein
MIRKRGRHIATLVPARAEAAAAGVAKPDIMARLRETWGTRVFTLKEVAAMRVAEQTEDPG